MESTQPTNTVVPAVAAEPLAQSSLTETPITEPPITEQPVPNETPLAPAKTSQEEWSNELFNCLQSGLGANDCLCLKATCCPCFTYGKQQHRLRDPTLANYERFNFDCMAYCLSGSWAFNFVKRGELRKRYNIRGDQMQDCLEAALCGCCVLIQQDREIIGRQAAIDKRGYVKTPGMNATNQ